MQLRTLLVLSALVLAVAAPNYGEKSESGYKKESSEPYQKKESEPYHSETAPYQKESSSSGYESSSGGYGYQKPHFPAPSFGARMKARLHRLGHALHHLLGEFVHFFHTRWVNFKSDMERIHWWLTCHRQHFHIWWKWKCDVAAKRRQIRSEYEQQIYDSLCEMERTKKHEYESRVKECETSGEDYSEDQVTNYVDAVYEESSKKYEESTTSKKY